MTEVVEIVRAVLAGRPEPLAAAWVFGSRATGAATGASALDLALLYAQDAPRTLLALPMDLKDALERAIGLVVDSVIYGC